MATRRAQGLAKRSPELRVRSTDIRQAIEAARSLGAGAVDDFELARDEILSQLRADPDMHEALAGRLRRDFDANLDQSHDFLQLVKLVRGHAEALLLKAHPKMDVLEAAEHEPNLGAIYFSTELMLIKMDSLAFLREINLALESSPAFQVHPYVLKYVRIYNWQAKQKNLHLRVTGSSHGRITLNSKAIGFVVQGLLDNLVKYAPAGSDAAAHFSETEDFINIEFVGLGPRIAPNELEQIFLPGFRAAAAREIEASGLGVGLATAKQISNILDLQLTVRQSPKADAKYAARYETAFGVRLPRTN